MQIIQIQQYKNSSFVQTKIGKRNVNKFHKSIADITSKCSNYIHANRSKCDINLKDSIFDLHGGKIAHKKQKKKIKKKRKKRKKRI